MSMIFMSFPSVGLDRRFPLSQQQWMNVACSSDETDWSLVDLLSTSATADWSLIDLSKNPTLSNTVCRNRQWTLLFFPARIAGGSTVYVQHNTSLSLLMKKSQCPHLLNEERFWPWRNQQYLFQQKRSQCIPLTSSPRIPGTMQRYEFVLNSSCSEACLNTITPWNTCSSSLYNTNQKGIIRNACEAFVVT